MTTADSILDQIDSTLADYRVSDDAMRSRPAPEPEPEPVKPQLWIAPVGTGTDDDGWQPLGTVDGFDMQIDPASIDPAATQTEMAVTWQELHEHIVRMEAERVRRAQAVFEAFGDYFRSTVAPAVQEAGRNIAAAAEQLKQAGIVDAEGKPARPRDRPAWQSPYGPAQRRR